MLSEDLFGDLVSELLLVVLDLLGQTLRQIGRAVDQDFVPIVIVEGWTAKLAAHFEHREHALH
jgi:hypothetical protein